MALAGFDVAIYAAVGKVSELELKEIESSFVELLQWNLEVCSKSCSAF